MRRAGLPSYVQAVAPVRRAETTRFHIIQWASGRGEVPTYAAVPVPKRWRVTSGKWRRGRIRPDGIQVTGHHFHDNQAEQKRPWRGTPRGGSR
ncbi:hypothetical protein GCM10023083_69830 [Streptomyces phyllanthi]